MVYQQLNVPPGDSPNNYTIEIEMCVNSDGDFSVTRHHTIELVRHLLTKHNLDRNNLCRHYDVTGKNCPKMMLEDAVWNSFLDEIFDGQILKVNTAELNVRQGPGTQFPIVRKVHQGDELNKLGQSDVWYRIGVDEWVHSHDVIQV